jgi:hypothetical protein
VDAGFPVMTRNEAGQPEVTPLAAEFQNDTGVIFASSFPCVESCIREVSKAVEGHLGASKYEFDRKLLFKLLVMANNQLAELVKARGPNTYVNSACSSTSQAIAIAEDWLRMRRCRRVVVVGADNSTSEHLLPYIGTGFLALTAASIAPTVEEGALPFDKRRNGKRPSLSLSFARAGQPADATCRHDPRHGRGWPGAGGGVVIPRAQVHAQVRTAWLTLPQLRLPRVAPGPQPHRRGAGALYDQ